MAELATRFPEDMKWAAPYDPTVFVRDSIRAVVQTLLEAVVLVVLVVILFLQTWRASIIPLIAVPVSVVGTFSILYLLGFSLNTLSLFGLVLAIGIVVDDAIVVVENVERNIEEGLAPLAAAHQAMREVSGPIIAIALVLCAVFVPMAFLSGVTGQFYKQFGDHRHLDGDLGHQLADALPGAGGPAVKAARREERPPYPADRSSVWLDFPSV
jgi:multidrug efflux pump